MFQDMIKSQQVMADFKKLRSSNQVEGIEFSSEILTSSHWPISEFPKCTIPMQLSRVKDHFNNFYKTKFQNREIQWLFNHGNIQI